jgi:hypothetical protein
MLKKSIGVILVAIIIAAGIWYYKTNIEGITFIGKIVKDARVYEGKMITIKGTVTERVSFMTMKYFKLKDRTGEIMVITENPLPPVGDKIAVQGMVHDAFSLGGEQLLVFIEKEDRISE